MSKVRDFDAEIDTTPREDEIAFKLFGRKWVCADDVNGKRLLDDAALLDSDSVKDQRDGVIAVFEDVLDSNPQSDDEDAISDLDEFMGVLNDPKTRIPLGTLVEVVGYLVEQYTDRPTERPANSPNGRGSRGRTSTARPSARGSRSVRSVPATS